MEKRGRVVGAEKKSESSRSDPFCLSTLLFFGFVLFNYGDHLDRRRLLGT